ncbi:hypothetical protein HNR67_006487 [Crossiella cryophila]|uniref:Uncharacterized protein n=1 Tax=Crossiella cryophila TaxID=43355 RepID=A0A7W7CFS4_9PSEU|nr:hypothetical protein [Crossiella cryophila]
MPSGSSPVRQASTAAGTRSCADSTSSTNNPRMDRAQATRSRSCRPLAPTHNSGWPGPWPWTCVARGRNRCHSIDSPRQGPPWVPEHPGRNPSPARAPKPSRPDPGRPASSKTRHPVARHDVGESSPQASHASDPPISRRRQAPPNRLTAKLCAPTEWSVGTRDGTSAHLPNGRLAGASAGLRAYRVVSRLAGGCLPTPTERSISLCRRESTHLPNGQSPYRQDVHTPTERSVALPDGMAAHLPNSRSSHTQHGRTPAEQSVALCDGKFARLPNGRSASGAASSRAYRMVGRLAEQGTCVPTEWSVGTRDETFAHLPNGRSGDWRRGPVLRRAGQAFPRGPAHAAAGLPRLLPISAEFRSLLFALDDSFRLTLK